MKAVKQAKALTGKYKNKVTGKDQKTYLRCGTLFEREDGTFALKLDGIPVTPEWTGWINFYDLEGEKILKENGLTGDEEPPF